MLSDPNQLTQLLFMLHPALLPYQHQPRYVKHISLTWIPDHPGSHMCAP
jgi:hypothetical protein